MADLSELQSAQIVKLTGSDATGVEGTPVASTLSGELRSVDACFGGGVNGSLTVGTSAVEAKVGASPFTNRKLLVVFNNSNATIYWGYSSGVTTSNGIPILKNQTAYWDVSDTTSVYLISGSAGNNSRVAESG